MVWVAASVAATAAASVHQPIMTMAAAEVLVGETVVTAAARWTWMPPSSATLASSMIPCLSCWTAASAGWMRWRRSTLSREEVTVHLYSFDCSIHQRRRNSSTNCPPDLTNTSASSAEWWPRYLKDLCAGSSLPMLVANLRTVKWGKGYGCVKSGRIGGPL